jgi:hypothetical protein
MKNTFIPLDMLFVAADGKVIRVAENTEPHFASRPIESNGDAIAVIELKAGIACAPSHCEGARGSGRRSDRSVSGQASKAEFASRAPKKGRWIASQRSVTLQGLRRIERASDLISR